MATLRDGMRVHVARTREAVRCALCHDALGRGRASPCSGCGTVFHEECHAAQAGCPTLGCGRVTPRRRRALRLPRSFVLMLAAYLGCFALLRSPPALGEASPVEVHRAIGDADSALNR